MAEASIYVRRVGVVGDVHAEDEQLAGALEFFAEQGVERVLCVGDIADGRGDLSRCCELLASTDAVRGNHERWALGETMRTLPDASPPLSEAQRLYLGNLPVERYYDTPRGALLLCHGLGADDMAKVEPADGDYALRSNSALQQLLSEGKCRFVINGHSHRRMVRTIGGVTIINAGTLFQDHEPCLALVDFAQGLVRFHAVSKGAVQQAFEEHQLPGTAQCGFAP